MSLFSKKDEEAKIEVEQTEPEVLPAGSHFDTLPEGMDLSSWPLAELKELLNLANPGSPAFDAVSAQIEKLGQPQESPSSPAKRIPPQEPIKAGEVQGHGGRHTDAYGRPY